MYKAVQFEGPPETEIIGAAVLLWVENLASDITDPILTKFGLDAEHIDVNGWYNAAIMDAMFTEMYQAGNGAQALVAMGKAGAADIINQFGYTSVEDYMERCNEELALIRNKPEGYGYIVKKVADNHWEFTNNTNAPNDIIFGSLWEKIRLLREPAQRFSVAPIAGYYQNSKEGATFAVKLMADD